jgi:hypothetical protein
VHRLGITYHQPKKHKSDSKYTIAPREFLSTFNSVYPSFRKGESQEDAMEFFSKVRERLHDELRADLERRLRSSSDDDGDNKQDIDSNEQWIMGTSPISDIFRGYYVTKVLLSPLPHVFCSRVDFLFFSGCVRFVIPREMPPWRKHGNYLLRYRVQ